MIPPSTRLGAVHLTVADLARSLDYYRTHIGLEVLETGAGRARLGAGAETLLVLEEVAGARPADGYTGLFHFALLLPTRADLGRWLAHAAADGVALTGASDHAVSEALYLRDPDHHGIELYADRPRATWEGRVAELMTSVPLDLDALAAAGGGEAETTLPPGTTMGHVHLRVRDVPEAVAFYRDAVGFDLMASLGRQAAFLAAGGYHHHLGANAWESAGAVPAPDGHATLRHAVVELPDAVARDALADALADGGHAVDATPEGPLVRDPSGNALLLAAG